MVDTRTQRSIGDATLRVVQGDVTTLEVDAVVNAANEQLAHGGGVAAALARGGGPTVQRESDAWVAEHGHLQPGRAAITTAGDLPAGMIVHVVGPRYRDGQDNEGLLTQAVTAALDVAAGAGAGATSVALPAISAGIFGYPPPQATAIVARVCARWLAETDGPISDIVLVGFDTQTAQLFTEGVEQVE